jgi:uncharacterized protein YraI
MRKRELAFGLVALLLLMPVPALAQVMSQTTQPVNVRAGPDRTSTVVTWLPGGSSVRIVGCTRAPRWCQIVAGRYRGWINGHYLVFPPNQPIRTVNPRNAR